MGIVLMENPILQRKNLGPKIIQDPINELAFLESGVCYKQRESEVTIDTLIVHSCYVADSIIAPDTETSKTRSKGFYNAVTLTKDQRNLKELILKEEDPSKKEVYQKQAQELEFFALHTLICERNGKDALSTFNKDAMKSIFEFYGVSAHYVIDRDGKIFEFVPPELLAFHAGVSTMPNDGRERVNGFSIGVELLGNAEAGYTHEQYNSLADLTIHLKGHYPLTNFFGHAEIAPGRKIDPENFDWQKYRELAGI
jgi:hypothetical protein